VRTSNPTYQEGSFSKHVSVKLIGFRLPQSN
jgi:hypothetical protein